VTPVADTAAIRASLAACCREFARLSGDGRFNAAAAMLEGKPAGRKRRDDARAIEYAEKLIAIGMARSITDAAVKSAKIHANGEQVKTMAERIRKKLGGN
jgi:hypothetical protein